MILETINANDVKEKTASGVSVVLFSKEICPFCKTMKKVLGKVQAGPNVRIMEIDGVLHRPVAEEHKVARLPTIVFFKDGQEGARVMGVVNAAHLQKILDPLVRAQNKG